MNIFGYLIENTFSQIRAMGGNNFHPNSLETINRIRTLCFTKNVKEIIINPSIEVLDDDEFLSVNMVDNLNLNL